MNQYALFSVVSSPRISLSQWLEERPDMYRKLIIDRSLKWEIRDKLDQANINERVLFPGLDGLSRWLRRQYVQPGSYQAVPPSETPSEELLSVRDNE